MKALEAYVGQHALMEALLRQVLRDSDPSTTKDEMERTAEVYLAQVEARGVPFCLSLLGALSGRTWGQSRGESRSMEQIVNDTEVTFGAVSKSIFVEAGQEGL